MTVPDDQLDLIERTAEKTIEKFFDRLGIDVTDKDEIEAFRDDLRFARDLRRAARDVGKAGLIASVGTLATGIVALLGLGIKAKFGGP